MRKALRLLAVLVAPLALGCAGPGPGQLVLERSFPRHFTEGQLAHLAKCLPEGVGLDDTFSDSERGGGGMDRNGTLVTVRRKLGEIGAWCRGGVIYDRSGRKVYFLRVPEYGNPPPGYDKISSEQAALREKLEKEHYRVIGMYAPQMPV